MNILALVLCAGAIASIVAAVVMYACCVVSGRCSREEERRQG